MPENWGALSRGHTKHQVIRALAVGDKSQHAIAAEHGVSQQAVSQFAERNAARIAEVKAHLDDEFAGIAFAAKANRVAMLSQQIDDVTGLLADPETAAKAGVQYAEMARTAQQAARAISEELGQLPGRTSITVTGDVHYAVEGVQLGTLQ